MLFHQHLRAAFKQLKQAEPRFYYQNLRDIVKIVSEINHWFDDFAGKKGADKQSRVYDYTIDPTDPNEGSLRHREQRHHYEGLVECCSILSLKYDSKFRDIIKESAKQHIIEDMGYIPDKEEYQERNFWINWRRKIWTQELKLARPQ